MTDAVTLYLRAALGLIEAGWIVAADHDPTKGRAVFVHGVERIEYRRAYNGGQPLWRVAVCPVRLCGSLPEPFITPDAVNRRLYRSRL